MAKYGGPVKKVLRRGARTSDPVTIVIIANPALEIPRHSGAFVVDPVMANRPAFDACARYIEDALFGRLPGQQETLLADPALAPKIRVVSLFVPGLPAEDANSLVAEDHDPRLLVARRQVFVAFLARYALGADVAYAVSASATHTRASAWYTSDDDAQPGTPFVLDGATLYHRHFNRIPGAVAIHTTSHSLTALHEFGHALSSYTNGMVVDLYVDSPAGLNNKRGRPIPADFASLDGALIAADPTRDGLAYPPAWHSYHAELLDPSVPAVMDDYWRAPGGVPEHCRHDRITRQFLRDRLLAKISR